MKQNVQSLFLSNCLRSILVGPFRDSAAVWSLTGAKTDFVCPMYPYVRIPYIWWHPAYRTQIANTSYPINVYFRCTRYIHTYVLFVSPRKTYKNMFIFTPLSLSPSMALKRVIDFEIHRESDRRFLFTLVSAITWCTSPQAFSLKVKLKKILVKRIYKLFYLIQI